MNASSVETGLMKEDGLADDSTAMEALKGAVAEDGLDNEDLPDGDRIVEILEEERGGDLTNDGLENGISGHGYKTVLQEERVSETADLDADATESVAESLPSIPDDTPSIQGSVLSSPGSSILPSVASRPALGSPTPSLRPFDRRFQSRLTSSPLNSPRAASPAFLTGHSRQGSLSSQFILDSGETETPTPPWEVVRWTKLKKLNGQAFSETGKRNFGTPTCISISASIVLGTSKGIILIFDYHQNLKSIIGPGTKAVESGAVTSIAMSADHSTVAGGHADGSIFTWEISRSARPFLQIPHLSAPQVENRTLDGHVPNVAITHLGFLGTRHTALVSADDRGMAFSHLATRGTGPLGRSVKTTRILGRYPNDTVVGGKARKPSTVLAFAPLPLGNVERGTDSLGLTAMLTPYLLVIVSTTPIAQTQHKAARPKEVAPHSAMSGCLAWFPAVKLKVRDPNTHETVSKVKLVYCWSNVLTVMDIDEVEEGGGDKQPSLVFKARSRWKADESIVAVQWLSRSVLAVLTITQRLVILEDQSMRMTEAFDLVQRHIFHRDLFSSQLHALVEQLDEEDSSMHGVVADAFYMSFKAYKGRIFLLGFNDVAIGTLSNWADRLIALMEEGDYINAIRLATSYYTGDADKLTVGLPEDTELRHSMVQDKLMEILTASLRFAFKKPKSDAIPVSDEKSALKELAEACFTACLSVGDLDFLFDEVFEWYNESNEDGIFLENLEPYILSKDITSVPPLVVKALVTYYVTQGMESRLEEMICHMDPATLDIDQLISLCKEHNLYDALIYVWNQALGDYISPLIDLLTLLVPLMQNEDQSANGDIMDDPIYGVNALKMFPYLAYTLTGRIYPTGEILDEQQASKAKAEVYWFLFSGKTITWPRGSVKPFLTKPSQGSEPAFPYLLMILRFDASSFLSALNEAFEDPFLNDTPDRAVNGGKYHDLPEEQVFGLSVNRQYIVSILLEVMNPAHFAPEDTIYLDMFIARNLPKFPQYLLLSGSALNRVLIGLCKYPGEDIADDAQLSAEYLLSVYHPTELASLIPQFRAAGFYRVLKKIYKADQEYPELLQAYFEDPEDREAVFLCIADILRARAGLSKRQVSDVHEVIEAHAKDLVDLDAVRTAQTIVQYAPPLHAKILEALSQDPEHEFIYLRTILEPETDLGVHVAENPDKTFVERYVRLMCKYDAAHVVEFVRSVNATDLRLEEVLPAMEDSGVVDAAIVLMAREGRISEAMKRLIDHLGTLESALIGLLSSIDDESTLSNNEPAVQELLNAFEKYINIGVWLCQGQSKIALSKTTHSLDRKNAASKDELSSEELLWLDFIDASVQVSRTVSSSIADIRKAGNQDHNEVISRLRTLVQRVFTALLVSTSTPSATETGLSFLRILRSFLTRASIASPNLSDLRAVLSSIFSAYTYEESILGLANRLLDKDLFVNVKLANELRQRGWRPRGSYCEGCRRRVWGPGAAGDIFAKWEAKQAQDSLKRKEKLISLRGGDSERGKGRALADIETKVRDLNLESSKGKGKIPDQNGTSLPDVDEEIEEQDVAQAPKAQEPDLGPLVVLACRHIFHQSCLEAIQVEDAAREVSGDGREFRCPIDG